MGLPCDGCGCLVMFKLDTKFDQHTSFVTDQGITNMHCLCVGAHTQAQTHLHIIIEHSHTCAHTDTHTLVRTHALITL